METLVASFVIGALATLLIDGWVLARRAWFGTSLPDYAMVGRWFGHMANGHFRHESIATSAPVRFERLLGWMAHYLIGIAFAALLIAGWGLNWVLTPTLVPALIVGVATVTAPWLVMQPAMGAGIAARNTRRPSTTRLQNLVTHLLFGMGLYASAVTWRLLSDL